jgi:cell division control protein 6
MFEDTPARQRLLSDETYLTTSYQPEKPVGRAAEIKHLAAAVRPITHRKSPENLVLYGPAGVGKTTVVKHVFDRLEEETRVATAFINCWQYSTRSALLTELLISLGYPAPRKGKPVDELLAKFREWLEKRDAGIVALDEFDQLKHLTRVVYDLRNASEQAETAFGIVLLSNHSPSRIQLDDRSRSRLSYDTLEFTSYTSDDLVKILRQRVDHAFRRGTVTGKVLEVVADAVSEQGGDCRQALNLLLRAGRTAENQRAKKVTVDHVEPLLESLSAEEAV